MNTGRGARPTTQSREDSGTRITFTSRLSLLLLSFVAAMLIFPAMAFAETVTPDGTTGASLPTIQTEDAAAI